MTARAPFRSWAPPVLVIVLLLLLAVGRVVAGRARVRAEAAWLVAARAERDLRIPSSEDDEAALERRLVAAKETAARLGEAFRAPEGCPPPADEAALLSALAALWDECRGQAAWADVPFPRGDGLDPWGIDSAEIRPESIPLRWLAAQAFAHTLAALIESAPDSVLAAGAIESPSGGEAASAMLRLAGVAGLEGRCFRVEFSGSTAVLRAFLDRLAGSAWPIFVRGVECLSAHPSRVDTAVLLRPRFRVVVEALAGREPTPLAAR